MFHKELLISQGFRPELPSDVNSYFYRDCSVVESFGPFRGQQSHIISFKHSDFKHKLTMEEVSGILLTLGMDRRFPIVQFTQKNQYFPGSTVYFVQSAA